MKTPDFDQENIRANAQAAPGGSQSTPSGKLGGVHVFWVAIGFMIVSMVLCIGVGIMTFNVSNCYQALARTNDLATLCQDAVSAAGKTSDYLTAESRLFATTGDVDHARNYFDESERNKQREQSLSTIHQNYADPEVIRLLEDAMQKSNDLMATEEYSMALMLTAQGKVPAEWVPELKDVELSEEDLALRPYKQMERATEMLFNQTYARDKWAIDRGVEAVLDRIIMQTNQVRESESDSLEKSLAMQSFLIVLLMACSISASLIVIVLVVVPLRANANRLKNDERLEVKGSHELRYMAQTYNEIYDLKLANENALKERASHDPLTGALNRGVFDKDLDVLQNSPIPICLAIIDVDNFKQVNDRYGHSMGDKVLCVVAELLESRFRSTDIVARIGGDEFAVIAVDIPPQDAKMVLDKIEGISERLGNLRDDVCPVTISVGCAFNNIQEGMPLFNRADEALYTVKESGRNGIAFYDENGMERQTLCANPLTVLESKRGQAPDS